MHIGMHWSMYSFYVLRHHMLAGYHAPLDLYASISTQPILSRVRTLDEVNLCVGKEWYRVPSSFFLPDKRWVSFRIGRFNVYPCDLLRVFYAMLVLII